MSATLPPKPWVMRCGCTTHAVRKLPDGSERPVCFICMGIASGADELADAPPSLEGRRSRCSYNKGNGCPKQPRHAANYASETDSSWSLPFFSHQPDKPFDQHYCGCWGWD